MKLGAPLSMRRFGMLAALFALCGACDPNSGTVRDTGTGDKPGTREPAIPGHNDDSARAAFGSEVADMLLDTRIHEIRGHLSVKVRNPNRDDESPLADHDVPHATSPGPHTYLGILNAELRALRTLLGEHVPMTVEGERVFLGEPPVAIDGHLHDGALYVPVKAFARPYGAYVRIGCTLANCGAIWTADILRHMRSIGFAGAPGVLEAHAEGLIDTLDVRAIRPGG